MEMDKPLFLSEAAKNVFLQCKRWGLFKFALNQRQIFFFLGGGEVQ